MLGHPKVNWECKINPFKKQNEQYVCNLFLNDDYIFFASRFEDDKTIGNYLFDIRKDEWIDINLIEFNDSNDSNDNWVDKEKVFVLNFSVDVNNVLVIFLCDDIIKKKYITIPNVKNIGVSRAGKMFSKFDNITKSLDVISYQKLFDNDLTFISYPIKFKDDTEFYTAHNITEKAYVITSNKNIYVKFFEDAAEVPFDEEWDCIELKSPPSDTYIINDVSDNFIDTCSILWNGIIVSKNTCLLTTLAGDTYIMYNIKKDNIKITKSQLPNIFINEECFNYAIGKSIFYDKFGKGYKIQYFESKTDDDNDI
jgi:hypothetical protein